MSEEQRMDMDDSSGDEHAEMGEDAVPMEVGEFSMIELFSSFPPSHGAHGDSQRQTRGAKDHRRGILASTSYRRARSWTTTARRIVVCTKWAWSGQR